MKQPADAKDRLMSAVQRTGEGTGCALLGVALGGLAVAGVDALYNATKDIITAGNNEIIDSVGTAGAEVATVGVAALVISSLALRITDRHRAPK